jgi:hypothetical protein
MKYFTYLIILITILTNIGCSESKAIKSEIKTSALALILEGPENNNIAKSDVTEVNIIEGLASLKSSAFMNYNRDKENEFMEGTLSKANIDIFNNLSFIRIEGTIKIKSDFIESKVTKSFGQAHIVSTIKAAKACYYMIAYTMSSRGDVKNNISFSKAKSENGARVKKLSSNTDDPKIKEQEIMVGEVPVGAHILRISSDVNGSNSFSSIAFSVIVREK